MDLTIVDYAIIAHVVIAFIMLVVFTIVHVWIDEHLAEDIILRYCEILFVVCVCAILYFIGNGIWLYLENN